MHSAVWSHSLSLRIFSSDFLRLLWYAVADCKRHKWQRMYISTFIISFWWKLSLAAFSYAQNMHQLWYVLKVMKLQRKFLCFSYSLSEISLYTKVSHFNIYGATTPERFNYIIRSRDLDILAFGFVLTNFIFHSNIFIVLPCNDFYILLILEDLIEI